MGIRSLRLVDENNGLPRRPIGPPRNDKALQSVPIQNLRKIPVFFKYRHNKRPNMTALCNNTFYHGMGGFSRGELKVSERQMKEPRGCIRYRAGRHRGRPLRQVTMAFVGADLCVRPFDDRCTHETHPHPSRLAPCHLPPGRGKALGGAMLAFPTQGGRCPRRGRMRGSCRGQLGCYFSVNP